LDPWRILELVLGSGFFIALLGFGLNELRELRNLWKQHRQARVCFERAQRIYKQALRAEQRRAPLVLPGDELDREHRTEDPLELRREAQKLLDQAMEVGPDRLTEAKACVLQAQMLLDDKAYTDCIEYLDKALRLDRRLATGYEIRGQAHVALGHKELALMDYNSKFKLDPLDESTLSRIESLKEALNIADKPSIWRRARSIGKKGLWISAILA